ncbi:MAG: large-conductance mechanosensitive channel protein MscL, partial [Anaerolineaceae bacterium]
PIGLLLGKVDFSKLFISLSGTKYASLAAAQEAGAPTLNYGMFLNTIIEFLIIAFVIFLVVRQINRLFKPKPVSVEPTTKTCPFCQTEIPIKAVRCPHCTSEL